jgi:hypothetical protein
MSARPDNGPEHDERIARLFSELAQRNLLSSEDPNVIVNVAALLEQKEQIEEALGERVDDGDYFRLLANAVMRGGVLVLTDESTTGTAVSVEFSKKKIEF